MRSSRVVGLIGFLAVASFAHAQGSRDKEKQLVYDDVTEGSFAIDRDAKKAYAGKFRFVDIKQKDGFSPGGVKGFPSPFRDPRSMRDSAIRGKVVYVFIVTPDGRVIEPRILHSTDERVSSTSSNESATDDIFPRGCAGHPSTPCTATSWSSEGKPRQAPGNTKMTAWEFGPTEIDKQI